MTNVFSLGDRVVSKRIVLVAAMGAFLSLGPMSGSAQALQRECGYQVRVKSNGSNINSLNVPNGEVRSVGDEWDGGNQDGKRMARERASEALKACMREVFGASGPGVACRLNDNPNRGHGAMLRLPDSNPRRTALNALCNQARQLGLGDRVRDYEIYTQVQGGSNDVKRQCSSAFGGNHYVTWERGGAIACANGLYAPISRSGWTDWIDASGSDVRRRAGQECARNFPGTTARIQGWEVSQRNGTLRAQYACE
jgi:hypothetical protein